MGYLLVFVAVTKFLGKETEERCILGPGHRAHHGKKRGWQWEGMMLEQVVASPIASTVRRQQAINAVTNFPSSLFCAVKILDNGMLLPTCRLGLPTSVHIIQEVHALVPRAVFSLWFSMLSSWQSTWPITAGKTSFLYWTGRRSRSGGSSMALLQPSLRENISLPALTLEKQKPWKD